MYPDYSRMAILEASLWTRYLVQSARFTPQGARGYDAAVWGAGRRDRQPPVAAHGRAPGVHPGARAPVGRELLDAARLLPRPAQALRRRLARPPLPDARRRRRRHPRVRAGRGQGQALDERKPPRCSKQPGAWRITDWE